MAYHRTTRKNGTFFTRYSALKTPPLALMEFPYAAWRLSPEDSYPVLENTYDITPYD